MNEDQITTKAPQEENSLIKIGGIIFIILFLLSVLAYAITPVRQTIIFWWQDMQEAQQLRALADFEKEQPQGDLTKGAKLRLLDE